MSPIAKFFSTGGRSGIRAAAILGAVLLSSMLGTAASAQESLDQLLDNAEKSMRDSVDDLNNRKTDGSLGKQRDAIQNLEQYLFRRGNPQTSDRGKQRTVTPNDLQRMLDDINRMSKSGDKEGARQLLEQLQQMLENLQMAQPGDSGDSDMEQAMNELGDMIRKQQQLRDKTFKQGQDSRRDRMRGKQGEQGMGDLQQDQQNLRDRLKKLQEQLAKRGMGPGQRGEKGNRGEQGQQGDQDGDGEDGLDQADSAMGDASGRLGEGNADGAVDSQGRALDALRKGAQSLADAMQQEGDGDQPGDGPGNRPGRQQAGGNQTDPLGRPLRGREFGDDLTVKIPGEIDVQRVRRILEELRRRLADPARPQIELDYIERLLKDY